MAGRTFRFGVQSRGAACAQEWRDIVREVEDLGYSTLCMPDHFVVPEHGVHTPFAPLTGIAIAAALTETLRIGTLALANDYRHPAVVAKELATLDVLSDGRVEAGIGAGWMKVDYDALGWPYERARLRIERLSEAVAILKGAWGREPFSLDGRHYDITDYDASPKPVQHPHPPILIGGGGERLLRLAGREADIVGLAPNARRGRVTGEMVRDARPSMTKQKVEWVREGAGRRFDELELQIRYFVAGITDDRHGFAAAVADRFDVSPAEVLDSAMTLFGTVDECCDVLERRREEWGVSYVVIGDGEYRAFAPVVSRLAGT